MRSRFCVLVTLLAMLQLACSIPDGDDVTRINATIGGADDVYTKITMIRKAKEFLEGKKGSGKGPLSAECRRLALGKDGTTWEVDEYEPWLSQEEIFGSNPAGGISLFAMQNNFVSVTLMLTCINDGRTYVECAALLGGSLSQVVAGSVNKNAADLAKFYEKRGTPFPLEQYECRWVYAPGYSPSEIDPKITDPNSISERDRFVERMRGDAPVLGSAACTAAEMMVIDGVSACMKFCPMSGGVGCPNGPTDIFGTITEPGDTSGGDK